MSLPGLNFHKQKSEGRKQENQESVCGLRNWSSLGSYYTSTLNFIKHNDTPFPFIKLNSFRLRFCLAFKKIAQCS